MTNHGDYRAEDGAVARGLGGDVRGETSWRQSTMYPPEIVTVRLDLGWYRPEDVGMFAGEAWVSTTHELLALEVHPSRRYNNIHEFLTCAQEWQKSLLHDLLNPDPFPPEGTGGADSS